MVLTMAVGSGLAIRQARAASDTWAAAPADGTFSNAANWVADSAPTDGATLNFDGSSITTLTDDIAGLSVSGITFAAGKALIRSAAATC